MSTGLRSLTRMMGPKQIVSVLDSFSRMNIWHGSIRSGKTFASIVAFLMAVNVAPSNGLIIISGRTLDSIGRNIMEPLTDDGVMGRLISGHVKWTPGATTAIILGRTVHLIGAFDKRSEGKIRGATVALCYVDEATLLPFDFFRQLLGRMSVKGARLFATTNPDNPAHWLKKEYLNRQNDLNLSHWQFGLDDNPSLDPQYVRDLKSEYTGLWYKRFILGQWVQSEGAIYEDWNPDRHVVDVLPQMTRWLSLGVDYGTTNPFAGLTLGIGTDKRLYLAREFRWDSKAQRKQLTDVEYSQRLRQFLADHPIPGTKLTGVRPEWVVIDPSAASFRVQLYEDGLVSRLASNEVKPGINTVSSLIATDRLRVHRSCQGWIDEAPGYAWDEKSSGKGQDTPIKADDHSLDAGRYAIYTTRALWQGLLRNPVLPEDLTAAA